MANEIGFIGVGAMGLPMAENLIAAGYQLRVHNRTAAKAAPLADRGAQIFSTAAQTAISGSIVITIVSDDAALENLVVGPDTIAHRLAPGGVHLSMSTVSPALSRRLADYHKQCGSEYVAAPVLGRPEAVKAGSAWLLASGPARAKDKVRPLLDIIGQKTFDMGEDPGAANVVKLAGNFMLIAAIEAMAEAFTMVEKQGVDPVAAMETLTETAFASPVYQGYGKAIAQGIHEPAGFRLELGLKDVSLMLAAGAEARAPMPLASLARDRFLASLAKGRGNMDWSAMALCAREDAGLPTRK